MALTPLEKCQSRERSGRPPMTRFNAFSKTDQNTLNGRKSWTSCSVIPLPSVAALNVCSWGSVPAAWGSDCLFHECISQDVGHHKETVFEASHVVVGNRKS